MSDTATATVEVLTAEVRVLMVGSRQVTLSVYNQLDDVPHRLIEPFGRVNPRDRESSVICVVGRQIETGTLARARTPYLSDEFLSDTYRDDAHDIVVKTVDAILAAKDDPADGLGGGPLANAVSEGARTFSRLVNAQIFRVTTLAKVLRSAIDKTPTQWKYSNRAAQAITDLYQWTKLEVTPTTGMLAGDIETSAIELIARRAAAEEEAAIFCAAVKASWAELPLIVLAGLR